MKKRPGTLRNIVGFSTLVIVALLIFQACTHIPFGKGFSLVIGEPREVKSKKLFLAALLSLRMSTIYEFHFKNENGQIENYSNKQPPKLGIRTDKITTPQIGPGTSDEELTAIGSHVTQRINAQYPGEIEIVLKQFK